MVSGRGRTFAVRHDLVVEEFVSPFVGSRLAKTWYLLRVIDGSVFREHTVRAYQTIARDDLSKLEVRGSRHHFYVRFVAKSAHHEHPSALVRVGFFTVKRSGPWR